MHSTSKANSPVGHVLSTPAPSQDELGPHSPAANLIEGGELNIVTIASIYISTFYTVSHYNPVN